MNSREGKTVLKVSVKYSNIRKISRNIYPDRNNQSSTGGEKEVYQAVK